MKRRTCDFCDVRARYRYEGTRFCSWHLIHLYCALFGEWHD